LNPAPDPWKQLAQKNAEGLENEIAKLSTLAGPIRTDFPLITKYQDFWNQARRITAFFKQVKPLAQEDRDRLWKQFSDLCGEVKTKQRSEYGTLQALSQGHSDEIMALLEWATLPGDMSAKDVRALVEHGHTLRVAGNLLSKYKLEMIAKHKKKCFERIQAIRKLHDAAWDMFNEGKNREEIMASSRIRENIENNYERCRKAAVALEDFKGIASELQSKIATAWNQEWRADAIARLTATQRRIRDVEDGIHKLETWIEEDERTLLGE
jgi:hypothetical protein